MSYEELLRAGKPGEALEPLQAAIREDPGRVELRVALFQVLALLGQWDRAGGQLDTVAKLALDMGLLAKVFKGFLLAEKLRAGVFAGKREPTIFGEPEPWVGLLVQATGHIGRGENAAGCALIGQALEQAPANPASVDGAACAWLADGDARLGPLFEAVINGRYYWVPYTQIAAITITPPEDLRDLIWAPSEITFRNGTKLGAGLFARYPGSEAGDESFRMGRRTDWEALGPDCYRGLGQRVWMSEANEYPLLATREIRFEA